MILSINRHFILDFNHHLISQLAGTGILYIHLRILPQKTVSEVFSKLSCLGSLCRWVVRDLWWGRFTLWRVCVSSFSFSHFCSTTDFLEIHNVPCLLSKWQMGQQSLVSHFWVHGGLRLYCGPLQATASVWVRNWKRALRQWGSIVPVSITFCKASVTHYIVALPEQPRAQAPCYLLTAH